ncbi:MAG: enolase C-terminal domain-like protein, partial [Chloroflexota bacterium]
QVTRVRVPFRAPFATATGTWTARDAWIVVRRLDDGRSGVGESAIQDGELVAALDMVRVDLQGPPDDQPWVGVNATIEALSTDAAVEAALDAVGAGYRTLKLKAGPAESARALVERLAAVRRAVGAEVALRLDVNGTWDRDGAIERLRALDDVGLQYVEQPCAPAALADAAALRQETGVAVAADDAVESMTAAQAILDAGAADVLVVKPGRVGGPAPASAIATMAAARGVPVVISSLFETGIGLAAGISCAATLPDVEGWPTADRDHGLATADLLVDDLIVEPLLVEGGRIRAPGGPGTGALGVRLDDAAVARFAVGT